MITRQWIIKKVGVGVMYIILICLVLRAKTNVTMLILQLIIYHLTMKGNFAEVLSDTAIEKLFVQFQSSVSYVLGWDEAGLLSRDVTFHLYTRKNPQVAQTLPPNHPVLLQLSYFTPKLKTYFVVHGYTDHKHREIIARLRLVLNRSEDANVIVVDWSHLARQIYFKAVNYTLPVGNYVGQFFSLLENNSVDLKNIHCIGHSLGAHVCGIAGAYVGGKLGRISGLDPAGPLYEIIEEKDSSEALDKTDAIFVDVIHTDADEFGIKNPAGHVDFYPNGGTSPQPGCTNVFTVVSCSHVRSVEFYTESIENEDPFEAKLCNITQRFADTCCLHEKPVRMGHRVPLDARGIYCLSTNAKPPFARRYDYDLD